MAKLFLDIGGGESVFLRDVVLILDAETATRQSATRAFLKKNSEKKQAVSPKKALNRVNSLILTNSFGEDRLYSSPKSPAFLKERSRDLI